SEVAFYIFQQTSPYAGAAISVEVSATAGKSLAEWSQSIAARPEVIVAKGDFAIAGEKAIKFSVRGTGKTYLLPNLLTYITIHDGWIYAFGAQAKDGVDCERLLGDFLDTVSFTPIETPSGHLEKVLDHPIEVFGALTIDGPDCMRKVEDKPTM